MVTVVPDSSKCHARLLHYLGSISMSAQLLGSGTGCICISLGAHAARMLNL
jgi:hypothetical protein